MAATKAKAKKRRELITVEIPPDVEAALSINKVAALLSLSRRAVERMISEGTFPPPDFHMFKRMPRWHKATFNTYYCEHFRKA